MSYRSAAVPTSILILLCSALLGAQPRDASAGPTPLPPGFEGTSAPPGVIIPGPVPFTLDAYSAVQLIAMVRRTGLLELRRGSERPVIIAVESIYAVPAGIIESYPAGARRRYDILLNGSPLDWDHTFIVYGEGLVNLRVLFTYRNQYPPSDLTYRIPAP
ncbi:hypothetical protein [Salinispira pacifica]